MPKPGRNQFSGSHPTRRCEQKVALESTPTNTPLLDRLGLGVWSLRLDIDWGTSHGGWVALVWAMLTCIAVFIQRSRTVLDAQAIEQSWMWRRRVGLHELALLKVMRVPGLEFLIAPRIYVRTLSGRFQFFYCHDRAMLEEFARLGQALQQHALRP